MNMFWYFLMCATRSLKSSPFLRDRRMMRRAQVLRGRLVTLTLSNRRQMRGAAQVTWSLWGPKAKTIYLYYMIKPVHEMVVSYAHVFCFQLFDEFEIWNSQKFEVTHGHSPLRPPCSARYFAVVHSKMRSLLGCKGWGLHTIDVHSKQAVHADATPSKAPQKTGRYIYIYTHI